MKHSDSMAAIGAALVKAQAEIKPVGKDAQNPHFRNRYATLDALTDFVRPILQKHGLTVIQGGTDAALSRIDGGVEYHVAAIEVETMLLHTSGEWISSSYVMPIEKATAQGAGSAITYGRRYGLSSLLALTTDEDDDGQEASVRSGAESKAADMKSRPAPREGAASEQTGGQTRSAHDKLMPFGKTKGKRLGDLNYGELDGAREWCEKTDATKFASLIADIGIVLASRNERPVASAVGVGAGFDDFPRALEETDDDLPF